MSSYFSQVARNLREMERVLDCQSFTWDGAQYPCILSDSEAGVTIDPHTGNTVEYTRRLYVRKEVLPNVPGVGKLVTCREIDPSGQRKPRESLRKINLVVEAGAYFVLHLIDISK